MSDQSYATLPGSSVSWIDDDDVLRDEGILFGLSGLDKTDGKQESIRFYFAEKIAACKRERPALEAESEAAEQRRTTLAAEIDEMEERLARYAADAETRAGEVGTSRDLLRYVVGIVLAIAAFALNVVVISEIMNGFAAGVWATLGVMTVGMFILAAPVAAIFRSEAAQHETPEAPETWKVWLAEVVPPLAAAMFAVVWSTNKQQTVVRSTFTFVFIAALFFFGGKLLLSLLPKIAEVWKARRQRREADERVAVLKIEIAQAVQRREELRGQVEALRRRARGLPSEDELNELCQRKIRLFMSEYEMARAAGQRLGY